MRFSDLSPTLASWLADATNTVLVTEQLRLADPVLGDRLVKAAPKRLRLKDSSGICDGSYVLTLRTDGDLTEDVQVAAIIFPPVLRQTRTAGSASFGKPGWTVHLDLLGIVLSVQPVENDLVWFAALADPVRAPAIITDVLRTGTRSGDEIEVKSAVPTVMRYKRGSRCTFRYEVVVEGEGSADFPSTMIAKTYSGGKGVVAERSMRALWNSSFRTSPTVAIAEPLGYDADRQILLQGPVPEERTLKKALVEWFAGHEPHGWDSLLAAVRRAGVGLAEMHSAGVEVGDPVGIDDELEEVHDRAARVSAVFTDIGPMLRAVVEIIDQMAVSSEPEPTVGSHRSFRPAQVLLAGPNMSFIDFDGFCQAEPAMDVALFSSMIRSISLNKGIEETASLETQTDESRMSRLANGELLCQAFIEGYRSIAPISAERLLLWETVHVASVVVASWTKLKLSRLPNSLFLLDDQLRRSGVNPNLR